jgi:hypothetical protein
LNDERDVEVGVLITYVQGGQNEPSNAWQQWFQKGNAILTAAVAVIRQSQLMHCSARTSDIDQTHNLADPGDAVAPEQG